MHAWIIETFLFQSHQTDNDSNFNSSGKEPAAKQAGGEGVPADGRGGPDGIEGKTKMPKKVGLNYFQVKQTAIFNYPLYAFSKMFDTK